MDDTVFKWNSHIDTSLSHNDSVFCVTCLFRSIKTYQSVCTRFKVESRVCFYLAYVLYKVHKHFKWWKYTFPVDCTVLWKWLVLSQMKTLDILVLSKMKSLNMLTWHCTSNLLSKTAFPGKCSKDQRASDDPFCHILKSSMILFAMFWEA